MKNYPYWLDTIDYDFFRTSKLMKLQTLKLIIEKKKNKSEFAIITNLSTGESEIYEPGRSLSKKFETHKSY